jgi:GNAT superfamily N-acetyltransferase
MATVDVARPEDVQALVELVAQLFRDDAGRYGTHVDISWPIREGLDHYTALSANPSWLLLVARDDDMIIGMLVGHVSEPSPTRQPVRFAVLQSLYVETEYRSRGIGGLLTQRFLDWAREHGCVEAIVNAYVANETAQRFYVEHGFVGQSLELTLALHR